MRSNHKKWEYLSKININKDELNELGINGWELISVNEPRSFTEIFYFKREKLNGRRS